MYNFLKMIAGLFDYRIKIYKPPKAPPHQYPDNFKTLKVDRSGRIKWINKKIYIKSSLAGEYVGIRQIDDQFYEIFFGNKLIDTIDRFRPNIY